MQTLITFDVNQVEISQFITKGKNLPIRDPQDFERLKQVRDYWTYENDLCIISICDVDFEYNDENLGFKESLCITSLTVSGRSWVVHQLTVLVLERRRQPKA